MNDTLSFEDAQQIARRLKVMKGYPWDEEANFATATALMKWCRGYSDIQRTWSAKQQATWVVMELILRSADNGEEWEGLGQLRAIFTERFGKSNPVEPERRPYETPLPPSCAKCNDTGWESIEKGNYTYSRTCSCGVKKKPAEVCSTCCGKEIVLAHGVRQPCPDCTTPQRQQAVLEFLEQQRHREVS